MPRLKFNNYYGAGVIEQSLYQSHHTNFEGQCELEAKGFIESVQTKDFTEGVQAFIEKRSPKFGG